MVSDKIFIYKLKINSRIYTLSLACSLLHIPLSEPPDLHIHSTQNKQPRSHPISCIAAIMNLLWFHNTSNYSTPVKITAHHLEPLWLLSIVISLPHLLAYSCHICKWNSQSHKAKSKGKNKTGGWACFSTCNTGKFFVIVRAAFSNPEFCSITSDSDPIHI